MIFDWIKALFKALGQGFSAMMRAADGLTVNQWYIVMAVVVVVGMLSLRGFGSRKGGI